MQAASLCAFIVAARGRCARRPSRSRCAGSLPSTPLRARRTKRTPSPRRPCHRRTCRPASDGVRQHISSTLPNWLSFRSWGGGRQGGVERFASVFLSCKRLTFPYMTYSQSSAKPPSMSARQPPAPAPSFPAPSGLSVLASARLKVESVGRSIRSVLICVGVSISDYYESAKRGQASSSSETDIQSEAHVMVVGFRSDAGHCAASRLGQRA